ncbi:MAG TPA: S41 family peptidase [Acidobacteriota bacterium]
MSRPARGVWIAAALLVAGGLPPVGGLPPAEAGPLAALDAGAAPSPSTGDVLAQIFTLIERNYVDGVERPAILRAAVEGMLEKLDPHSSYFDSEEYKQLRERYSGVYTGIGVEFAILDGWITITEVYADSPAEVAGLQLGDQIVAIDERSAYGLDRDQASALVQDQGPEVTQLTINRFGERQLMHFTVRRGPVRVRSVRAAFMLDHQIGFIRMSAFAHQAGQELDQALERLIAQGARRLILDLRGNPGGLLQEAIAVADRFLPGGRKIVMTLGRRANLSDEYYTTDSPNDFLLPLIVLINHDSASASEIVAGALQDQDRALLLGETTYGKGLVQSQFRLPDGGALLLTVARYYTPSGRPIQKEPGGRPLVEGPVKTAGGRIIPAGGGIHPDVPVEVDTAIPPLVIEWDRDHRLFQFAYRQLKISAKRWERPETLVSEQLKDPLLVEDFRRYLEQEGQTVPTAEFAASAEELRQQLIEEMVTQAFGNQAGLRLRLQRDPQFQQAIELFPTAAALARSIQPRM